MKNFVSLLTLALISVSVSMSSVHAADGEAFSKDLNNAQLTGVQDGATAVKNLSVTVGGASYSVCMNSSYEKIASLVCPKDNPYPYVGNGKTFFRMNKRAAVIDAEGNVDVRPCTSGNYFEEFSCMSGPY